MNKIGGRSHLVKQDQSKKILVMGMEYSIVKLEKNSR